MSVPHCQPALCLIRLCSDWGAAASHNCSFPPTRDTPREPTAEEGAAAEGQEEAAGGAEEAGDQSEKVSQRRGALGEVMGASRELRPPFLLGDPISSPVHYPQPTEATAEAAEEPGAWEETFKTHTDTKPNGEPHPVADGGCQCGEGAPSFTPPS